MLTCLVALLLPMPELARQHAGISPDSPHACDVVLGDVDGDERPDGLATCTGADHPQTAIILLQPGTHAPARTIGLSRPGVPAQIEFREVTGDSHDEIIIRSGGGGTLEQRLDLTILQWTPKGLRTLLQQPLIQVAERHAHHTVARFEGRVLHVLPARRGAHDLDAVPISGATPWRWRYRPEHGRFEPTTPQFLLSKQGRLENTRPWTVAMSVPTLSPQPGPSGCRGGATPRRLAPGARYHFGPNFVRPGTWHLHIPIALNRLRGVARGVVTRRATEAPIWRPLTVEWCPPE